jgi:hypothetical protein
VALLSVDFAKVYWYLHHHGVFLTDKLTLPSLSNNHTRTQVPRIIDRGFVLYSVRVKSISIDFALYYYE